MVLFRKRLKELRKETKLTQKGLGQKLNLTKSTICSYEKGNRMAPIETLIDLATFFKVDLDYLVGTENYIVSDNDEEYGIRMSNEEINLIKELRKHQDLYENMIDDPKRTIELIEKKIR